MCRHMPWLNRRTLSTQRVAWPMKWRSRCRLDRGSRRCWIARQMPERDDNLRHDRNIQRTFRVSGSLQTAGVGQRHGDQQARKAQYAEQLHADFDDRRIVHAENRQQLPWENEKEKSDNRCAAKSVARRRVHRGIGAIGTSCAEILSCHRGRSAHQADGRPGDQREQLRIRRWRMPPAPRRSGAVSR